jgi:hypothetical protein
VTDHLPVLGYILEGRLTALPGLEKQEIRSNESVSGSGLQYVPVEHQGKELGA